MVASTPTRILIVDDHPLVREGLKGRLASHADWTICGEAETAREAIRMVRELSPRVVIIDLSLKDGSGLELIKQIGTSPEGPLMLVCSMHDEELYALRAIQAGAMGYLHKQEAAEKLIPGMERILEGKLFVSDEVLAHLLKNSIHKSGATMKNPIDQLTDRELMVFEFIGQGLTVGQIASSVRLSSKTVETYRDRIKQKLHLRTAAELMRHAVKWVTEQTGG